MAADIHAPAFYKTTRGTVATRLLRQRLHHLWPNLQGQAVLGVGYTSPYLRLWHAQAGRCIDAQPEVFEPEPWPEPGSSLTCAIGEDGLPFADLSFDRVLLVHGLEAAAHARKLLREVWRVLRDDGRLIVVAPNRVGMWAHLETTPFGHGQPYSPGQINRLLAASLFRAERHDGALFVPPFRWRPLLRGAGVWDAAGRRLAPRFAGLIITEAVKDAYAAIPARKVGRRVVAVANAA